MALIRTIIGGIFFFVSACLIGAWLCTGLIPVILDVNNHTSVWYYFEEAVFMLPIHIGGGIIGLYGIPFIIIQAMCFYQIIWKGKNLLHSWFATAYCQATLMYLFTSIFGERRFLWEYTKDFAIAVLFLVGIHVFLTCFMAWQKMTLPFPKTITTTKRIGVKIITLIFLLFTTAATWVYFEIWLPSRMIANSSKWETDCNGYLVPGEKIRDTCHKVLKYRFGNHHDAFIALVRVGNKDSIPYLIRALKRLEKEYPNEKNSGFVICTYGHCEEALEQLTGIEVDWDSETWMNWWKKTGRYLPFNEETRQLVLPVETIIDPKTQE